MSQSSTIREHNDRFRAGDPEIPGMLVATQGFTELLKEDGTYDNTAVLKLIAEYNNFNQDNDPHGEHDFGSFELGGVVCYWKIDLYNTTSDAYPDNPIDLAKTRRVLTVLLASEY